MLVGWLFMGGPVLLAQTPAIDPIGRNIRLTQERGVGVVEIERPNTKGLSHNLYRKFDVGKKGVILNNTKQGAVGTSLLTGGQLQGNANLVDGSAKVILNEVTSLIA